MHPSRMCTGRCLPYRGGVSAKGSLSFGDGGLCLGSLFRWGLCPGGSVGGPPSVQIHPQKEHGTRVRDPPGRNMGPGSQTGSDIIQRPPSEQND